MSDPSPSTSPPKPQIVCSEFTTSESTAQLNTALAIAQGLFIPAQQGAVNPHFNKSYSNIADVWEACRSPLSTNGLSVIQCPTSKPGSDSITLVTRLGHKSGEWIQFDLTFKAQMSNPQNGGSVITYMKRYCLSGLLGIVSREDDDDGEAGAGRGASASRNNQAPPPAAPQKKASSPPTTGTTSEPVPEAPPIPEAAAGFCKRFDEVQNPKDFQELVASTRDTFDDGTAEKKALSFAIKNAAHRLGIQPKKKNATTQGAST